jgi:DNA-binding transcriptional MocR family regulator
MTPQALFDYASGFAHPHRSYPTVREAAKHFSVTQQAVIDACEDWHGEGYMRPATGFRVGSGSGIASFERIGDYLVEAYQ